MVEPLEDGQRRVALTGIMVAMTDNTPPPVPRPGFVDLHARLKAQAVLPNDG